MSDLKQIKLFISNRTALLHTLASFMQKTKCLH